MLVFPSHRRQLRASVSRKAFTLIELLVVIAIIAILIALLVPAVQKVREAAARTQCQNNIRQIAIALHNYHDVNKKFPAGGNTVGNQGLSFLVLILPYVEQGAIRAKFNPNQGYLSATNRPLGLLKVPIYYCPSYDKDISLASFENSSGVRPYTAHYAGNMGPKIPGSSFYRVLSGTHGGLALQGVLGYNTAYRITDLTDGSSNTIMVGEMAWDSNGFRSWTRGCWGGTSSDRNCSSCRNITFSQKSTRYTGANFNDVSFGSMHTGGANFALGDGSVRWISENADLATYRSTASRDGGETKTVIE